MKRNIKKIVISELWVQIFNNNNNRTQAQAALKNWINKQVILYKSLNCIPNIKRIGYIRMLHVTLCTLKQFFFLLVFLLYFQYWLHSCSYVLYLMLFGFNPSVSLLFMDDTIGIWTRNDIQIYTFSYDSNTVQQFWI